MPGSESSNLSNADDLRLVARVHEGDLEAFSDLVRRHHERIYHTIYALVGDSDQADDLAQDVFIKAFRSLKTFRGQSQFFTWLYRIAVNCSLDHLKSAHKRHQMVWEQEHLEDIGALSGDLHFADDVDSQVARRELHETLSWALGQLPEEYRAAMVLREVDGCAYEEIAGLLKCSVGTVKSRLFRARARLRDLLKVHYKAWFEA